MIGQITRHGDTRAVKLPHWLTCAPRPASRTLNNFTGEKDTYHPLLALIELLLSPSDFDLSPPILHTRSNRKFCLKDHPRVSPCFPVLSCPVAVAPPHGLAIYG